ncbi:uncharacterized protein LY79DRAFT_163601 [Colletotrichum navitas]|uniref:Uncharacterized protein n=1 Tax=Colletotrichum navitas TaxID=681940 RepID=A0AAD8UX73_9PEZI|nr:uncharacterized protein LY79DRAFT_163601 [Colletotrichum navitas]KAK1564115.1 hypothetical protein LY79DRAFT_163601 [Colletotrichum navitas]
MDPSFAEGGPRRVPEHVPLMMDGLDSWSSKGSWRLFGAFCIRAGGLGWIDSHRWPGVWLVMFTRKLLFPTESNKMIVRSRYRSLQSQSYIQMFSIQFRYLPTVESVFNISFREMQCRAQIHTCHILFPGNYNEKKIQTVPVRTPPFGAYMIFPCLECS